MVLFAFLTDHSDGSMGNEPWGMTRADGQPVGKVFAVVRGKEDARLEGGEMRALEEVDNSGCVLNMKSRGLGDPLDQKGGGKKRT